MSYFTILIILHFLSFAYFSYRRSLRYLRYFQQEEYSLRRFLNWHWKNKAWDTHGSLTLITLMPLLAINNMLFVAVSAIGFIVLGYLEPNPLNTGKIRLKLTARASRILYLASAIFLFVLLIFYNYSVEATLIGLFLSLQGLPLFIVFSNFLLTPLEKYSKNKYRQEAVQILKTVNPYVIGITGSYGKTSVKAALAEVLANCLAPTFTTPKSINTEMGITREIRENMKDSHKYAVIEMGAYNVGSIQRLCDFTPPEAGIVTMVGLAHLERYGTTERIYQAKSELAQNIPSEGILVCNGDNAGARRMASEYPKKTTLLYGLNTDAGHLDCIGKKIETTAKGISFQITWQNKTYNGFTKLLGQPALSNLLAVFTMAVALGANPEFVLASISNIAPVDNRLAVSKEGQITYLKDAYNSNPSGFAAALELLAELSGNRKILMTPGMIELGQLQYEENYAAAKKAAKVCDLVIIVGNTNREALYKGLLENGFSEKQIKIVDTRQSAFEFLHTILQPDDMVLIENDLPDLYEVVEKF